MAYKAPAYRGDAVKNQRVDRIDEGLDTEQSGPGGTGKARATVDSGVAVKGRVRGAKSVLDTTAIGLSPDAATKRAMDSA